MVFIKRTLLIGILLNIFLLNGCSKKKDFQFCFSTMIEGMVGVSPVRIGNSYAPCGALGSFGDEREVRDNNYNFEGTIGHCGKVVDGYRMEIPDSAYFEWTVQYEGHAARPDLWERYEKKLALPPFPRLNPGEIYQVGFVIAYQDCVYVWIKTIPKY